MKHLKLTITALLLLSLLTFAQSKISYVGSSTVGKFMHEAQKVYTAATFTINTKPESGGGETAISVGKADLGGVARDVKPAIIQKGVKAYLIGKDAIGVWVNKTNAVSNLSKEQLKKIFTGKITNWKEVGGSDATINVYIVSAQSATKKVFQKVILGGAGYKGKTIKTIRPDAKIIDEIAKDKNGIGQLSFALGKGHPSGSKVKKVSVDGQAPTVNNPSYPITRPLHLITKGAAKGAVKDFIDWALSTDGQKVVKNNFIGI